MATGTPRKPLRRTPDTFPVVLSYPGKKSPESILADTPPGTFERVPHSGCNSKKRLYFGENLATLSHLAKEPEVCGKVRLVYIDPPFATQTAFHSRKLALNRPGIPGGRLV